jgi:hypothetical protein
MASKALNAANLEALGTTRLARLLIEISEGNAPVKRRPRLELAGADSPTAVTNQIRKRIATIARSHQEGHSAAASRTVAMVRSISRSDVNQLQTETRMTRLPRHVAPPNQATPSAWMRETTRSVRPS